MIRFKTIALNLKGYYGQSEPDCNRKKQGIKYGSATLKKFAGPGSKRSNRY